VKVAVVGAGVVGLSCAFALRRGGAEVTVYERGRVGDGCSRGNTGWICPGLSAPLPAPGVMGGALRGMLHRDSPLLISPLLGPSFLRWSWGFWRASSAERYRAGLEATVALTKSAFTDYDELRAAGVEFEMHSPGMLVAALTEPGLDEFAAMLTEAEKAGYEGPVRVISGDEARELDPALSGITPAGLERLLQYCIDAGQSRALTLKSIDEERRAVFPGGLAILSEIFEVLEVQEMRLADGAMREGLLYDMVGRLTEEDARERTVRAMQQRYHVDMAQAERVEKTALNFLEQVREAWKLEDPLAELLLAWAARLHEMGLDVSHSGYHRHGAYLLENADMFGFPREEQRLLAALVGGHRRKLSLTGLEELVPPWDRQIVYLIVLLRLAVLLHRGRAATTLPPIELNATPKTLLARFPARWLKDHPLTTADLQREVDYLQAHGLRLRIFSRGRP